ncbi:hypothetical protein CLOM_g612 [Closterium sp. NIES-68]|nr:hypothetical protein CLOM_g612 [Closterium sp. NIES-68]GJP57589.1 hypothetical protein CLOP_g21002 [Closterium sp. NIES-67]
MEGPRSVGGTGTGPGVGAGALGGGQPAAPWPGFGAAQNGPQLSSPFVVRFGQVFTGFGVGCGVGIGVGRPVNLGALPAASAVASMAGDFNRLAAGAAAPIRPLLRRLGVPHVDVGVGCGVGFGHGFGAGIALKPHVLASVLQSAQAVASRLLSHIPLEHRSHATTALSSTMPALSGSMPAVSKAAEQTSAHSGAHGAGVAEGGAERIAPGTFSGVSTAVPGRINSTDYSAPTAAVDQTKAQNIIMLSLLEQQADIRRLTQQVQALEEQHQHTGDDTSRCFECRQKSRRRTKSCGK